LNYVLVNEVKTSIKKDNLLYLSKSEEGIRGRKDTTQTNVNFSVTSVHLDEREGVWLLATRMGKRSEDNC